MSSLPNNYLHMASFDVSNLFTNIPLNECIDICIDLLFDNKNIIHFNNCTFDRNNFRKLLNLAVKDIHFMFNGYLYDQ